MTGKRWGADMTTRVFGRTASCVVAAALLGAAAAVPALAAGTSVGSAYFPGGSGLAGADGSFVGVGSCLSLANGVLSGTCAGSAGTSAGSSPVRPAQFEMEATNGAFTITAPYYLTTYSPLAGTITDVRMSVLGASGFNFRYTVEIVHNGVTTAVPGLTNVCVDDGEGGNTGCTGTYGTPLVTLPAGTATYSVGDKILLSFSTVGGTPTSVSVHMDLVQ